jgi:hypothetical protein
MSGAVMVVVVVVVLICAFKSGFHQVLGDDFTESRD